MRKKEREEIIKMIDFQLAEMIDSARLIEQLSRDMDFRDKHEIQSFANDYILNLLVHRKVLLPMMLEPNGK
jgi:hypothetical protein